MFAVRLFARSLAQVANASPKPLADVGTVERQQIAMRRLPDEETDGQDDGLSRAITKPLTLLLSLEFAH